MNIFLEECTMNKIFFGILLLVMVAVSPHSLRAEVNISIGFGLPEPVYFERPPEVIVLPDTQNVYVVPESEFDLFFWNGYWWRPWEGRWYRSRYYNRGWGYYNTVPSFYYDIDPGWRGYYRDRNWYGHPWHYERITYQRLQGNWKHWHANQYWQRNKTWGVEHYQPRPQRQIEDIRAQRQEQYRQRPEVQRHQQEIEERKRQPQAQQQEQIQEQQGRPKSPREQGQHEERKRQPQMQPQEQIREQQRQPQSPRQQGQLEERRQQPEVQRQQQQIQQQQRPSQVQEQQRQPKAQEQRRQVQESQKQPQAERQKLHKQEPRQHPQAKKEPKQQEGQQEEPPNRKQEEESHR